MNDRGKTALTSPADLETFRSLATDEILSLCGLWLEQELDFRKARGLTVLPLKSYLKNLFSPEGRIVRLGWEGYAGRLAPVFERLKASTAPPCILDAGCGYGTESLLFSMFPSRVFGVDLVPERIALAKSRAEFFQSLSKRPLDVTFISANIFRFLETSPMFDIIWALEAISHIYPAERFFALCRRRLKKNGRLIISDPNRLNPLALLRSIKIRGSIVHKPHQRFLDPDTRQPTDVGQEKIFSIFQIRRFLEAAGFRVLSIDVSGFMGSTVLPRALTRNEEAAPRLGQFQRIVKSIPVLRSLGSIYTLVAA